MGKYDILPRYLGTVDEQSFAGGARVVRDLLWLRRIRLDDVFIYLEQTMDIPYAKNGTIL